MTRGTTGASLPIDRAADRDGELAAWSAIAAVYQAVVPRVVARLEDEAGIDSGVFSVLAYLERADPPGRLALAELQGRMRVRYSQPGLSRLVQRMEADGLLSREPDPTDRRATVLVARVSGRRLAARGDAVYRAALAEHFGAFVDGASAARIVAALGPLAAALR